MDHAIVEVVTDDDRAVLKRLAALEAEVKADSDAQRARTGARKDAALAKLRDQRVTQTAEREQLRARQAELESRRAARPEPRRPARVGRVERVELDELDDSDARDSAAGGDHLENLGGALELASKASRVKQELQRTRKKGEKSWVASGVASLALGPIGWLYAGSWREAVPATAAWLALAALASSILPVFLMLPVLMVVLPLSGIAGVVYALQYNRSGTRQRLFGDEDKKPKQLGGERGAR
jgi:hypothetical protein